MYPVTALSGKRQEQLGIVQFLIQDQGCGNLPVDIMLRQKRLQNLNFRPIALMIDRIAHIAGKNGLVAQMTPAPDHRQIDAGVSLFHDNGNDIHIGIVIRLHTLLLQNLRKGRDLVPDGSGLLEFKPCRMALHLFLQFTQYSGLPASQKTCGIFDIAPVILVSDQTCTRATATVDLVKKTGPGPVFENTVLACSQPENLLQNLDRFPNGRSIGKRPEILVFPVNRSPVIHHTRETLPRYFQIGIGLVIPENDVVMRVKRLDQIALQQQRFHFAARHRRLQPRDTLDHHGNTWRRRRFLEIRTDPPDQIPALFPRRATCRSCRKTGKPPANEATA